MTAEGAVGKAPKLIGRTGKEIKPGQLGAKAVGKGYDRNYN